MGGRARQFPSLDLDSLTLTQSPQLQSPHQLATSSLVPAVKQCWGVWSQRARPGDCLRQGAGVALAHYYAGPGLPFHIHPPRPALPPPPPCGADKILKPVFCWRQHNLQAPPLPQSAPSSPGLSRQARLRGLPRHLQARCYAFALAGQSSQPSRMRVREGQGCTLPCF